MCFMFGVETAYMPSAPVKYPTTLLCTRTKAVCPRIKLTDKLRRIIPPHLPRIPQQEEKDKRQRQVNAWVFKMFIDRQ